MMSKKVRLGFILMMLGLCSLRFATKVNSCQIGTAKRTSKVREKSFDNELKVPALDVLPLPSASPIPMILETSISNHAPVIDHHILPHLGGHEAIKRISPQTVRIISLL